MTDIETLDLHRDDSPIPEGTVRYQALRHKPRLSFKCKLGRHKWKRICFEYYCANEIWQCSECGLVRKEFLDTYSFSKVNVGYYPPITAKPGRQIIELVQRLL